MKSGYGQFRYKHGDKHTHVLAHRYAYAATNDDTLNDSPTVLHGCDEPGCCNPAHLHRGTHAMNTRDMLEKGRHRPAKGVAAGKSKLTPAQVCEIRRLGAAGSHTQHELAVMYSVSSPTIHHVLNGTSWASIPGVREYTKVTAAGGRNGRSKLTDTTVCDVYLRKHRDGVRPVRIAAEFGMNVKTVYNIVSGHRWSHVTKELAV